MSVIAPVRHSPALVVVPLMLVILMGCGRFAKTAPPVDPLRLYLRMEPAPLRPGEPLIVDVLLLNTTPEPIPCAWLNHQSVTFYLSSPNLTEPARVIPVFSEKEPTGVAQELNGDGLWSRRFVFTQATATSGTYAMSAAFQQNPSGGLPAHYFTAAAPVEYRVEGAWAARRDRNGVLLKEEAIRLAQERAEWESGAAEARLIINEAGFYDWFVRFTASDGAQRAFLVNPYLAAVRQETSPALFPVRQESPIPKVMKKEN